MRTRNVTLLLAALLIPALSFAQSGNSRARRSAAPRPGAATATYKDLAGTFHGALKELTGKEIVILNEDNQTVSIRRTRKTKFLKDGREIKPSGIAIDTPLTIDAAEDIDLNPMALTVTVDSTPPKLPAK